MKKQNTKSPGARFVAWLKERVRKFFVALKKNPQAIPLIALVVTFVQYTLNLTDISNATSALLRGNLGLASFIIILFQMLSFVCMLNAFPKRKKPKVAMMILMVLLYGVVIYAEIHYLNIAQSADLSIIPMEFVISINKAISTLRVNVVLVAVTTVLMLLEPVIAKLVKKINTSIEVEGTEVESIDISAED